MFGTISTSVYRWALFAVTLALAAGVGSRSAMAKVYSLGGDARLQIGNATPLARPIPVGPTLGSHGRIQAISGAIALQTAGPDPKQMTIPPGQLAAPRTPVTIGLWPGALLFQLHTSIGVSFPGPGLGGVFRAGGRTGPPTVTFCPGLPLTPPPPCTPGAGAINGLMRYTRTAAQFGGAAQSALTGTANIALPVGTYPPCTSCSVIFAYTKPPPTGAQGAPFGFSNIIPGTPPTPNGMAVVNANASGIITSVIYSNLAVGITNAAQSFGGPWTTGMLTIQVTAAAGGPSTFILSGMDSRVNGIGNLSLVSGAIATRDLFGPVAHRGWLNLTVGNIAVPALSGGGLAAAFGLLGLAGICALRRWLRS